MCTFSLRYHVTYSFLFHIWSIRFSFKTRYFLSLNEIWCTFKNKIMSLWSKLFYRQCSKIASSAMEKDTSMFGADESPRAQLFENWLHSRCITTLILNMFRRKSKVFIKCPKVTPEFRFFGKPYSRATCISTQWRGGLPLLYVLALSRHTMVLLFHRSRSILATPSLYPFFKLQI